MNKLNVVINSDLEFDLEGGYFISQLESYNTLSGIMADTGEEPNNINIPFHAIDHVIVESRAVAPVTPSDANCGSCEGVYYFLSPQIEGAPTILLYPGEPIKLWPGDSYAIEAFDANPEEGQANPLPIEVSASDPAKVEVTTDDAVIITLLGSYDDYGTLTVAVPDFGCTEVFPVEAVVD